MKAGKIFMGVNVLSDGSLLSSIPQEVITLIIEKRIFIVENIKNARRFLKKLDRNFPIDDSQFFELGKHANINQHFGKLKYEIESGTDAVVLSDAGCSGVADPGSVIANWAHENNIRISPLVGPSSIILGLMASGFNGQNFVFHGYLPKDRKERQRTLKEMERKANINNQTQIFMDTPFRNLHVLEDVFATLNPETKFCIAADLTGSNEYIKTVKVKEMETLSPKVEKIPAMFLIGQ